MPTPQEIRDEVRRLFKEGGVAAVSEFTTRFEDEIQAVLRGQTSVGEPQGQDHHHHPEAVAEPEPEPEPTFEELFQEQLEELMGPDPGATFRNVFADVFGGTTGRSGLERFIVSQFDELQDAFVTFARTQAEQGRDIPTFERFLVFTRPSLERQFKFTEVGALENFNRILRLGAPSSFSRFVEDEFQNLFQEFTEETEAGTKFEDFGEFLGTQKKSLREKFQFTRPGARESFSNLSRLAGQGRGQLLSRFFGREDRFESLLSDFQKQGRVEGKPKTFAAFLGSRGEELERQFALASPFERGQRAPGQLTTLRRIQ